MKNKFLYSSFFLFAVLFVSASIETAQAQNTRRRTPTVSPTPTVQTNSQYLDGNQIVLGEVPRNDSSNQVVEPETPVITGTTGSITDSDSSTRIRELTERIKSLESNKNNAYDEKQKRLLLNLDILSRAETRAESLRKQLFEMIEKESGVQTRLEQIQYDARPEMIERSTAFVGSMRPEELRDQRKKSLEAEKRNLESLLRQIQTNRASLEENVAKADFLVERVRLKLDKEIDDALAEDKEN